MRICRSCCATGITTTGCCTSIPSTLNLLFTSTLLPNCGAGMPLSDTLTYGPKPSWYTSSLVNGWLGAQQFNSQLFAGELYASFYLISTASKCSLYHIGAPNPATGAPSQIALMFDSSMGTDSPSVMCSPFLWTGNMTNLGLPSCLYDIYQ